MPDTATPAADEKLIFDLGKPIPTARGPVDRLELRQPTLRDLRAAGGSYITTFVTTSDEGKPVVRTDFDPVRLASILANLSGLTEVDLDHLAAADAMHIATSLAPLFVAR